MFWIRFPFLSLFSSVSFFFICVCVHNQIFCCFYFKTTKNKKKTFSNNLTNKMSNMFRRRWKKKQLNIWNETNRKLIRRLVIAICMWSVYNMVFKSRTYYNKANKLENECNFRFIIYCIQFLPQWFLKSIHFLVYYFVFFAWLYRLFVWFLLLFCQKEGKIVGILI